MTPEQEKIQADAKAAVQKRIDELKAFEGKHFVRKDGKGGTIKILGYAGIGVNNGVSSHLFQAETSGARWTPPATKFLEEHSEVEAPKAETKNEGVI